jgi:hypothetical protein
MQEEGRTLQRANKKKGRVFGHKTNFAKTIGEEEMT